MDYPMSAVEKSRIQMMPIDKLERCAYQPRRHFDRQALEELAQTIREHGLIQPVVVRPKGKDRYEIIAGERRWRAAQLAGLERIECKVSDYDNRQVAEMAVIENLQREDLNPVEEAQSYQRLIDEFNYRHEDVAEKVGKSRTKITNCLRLLKLDKYIQEMLIQKQLNEGHGKVLAGLPFDRQYEFAKVCVDKGWSNRQLEAAVKRLNSSLPENKEKGNKSIQAIERALSDHVGSPARIVQDEDGKWHLEFACHNLDILEGVLQKMNFNYNLDCEKDYEV